ncbi:MAG: LysM peptidoglycan-binding domain-containing protein, partial [Eubacteriales bacterium]|nr:LysM peptidoglycan-binding domain-containing protein [Eubacteriales bacterium]
SSGTSGSSQTTTTTATSESTTTTSTATTTTTTTTSAGIMTTHAVVAGDTIWGLAMKYYGVGDFEHMNLIAEANGMKLIQDGDKVKLEGSIRVGDVLKIPNKP